MRADKAVFLVKEGEETYDPTTGDYIVVPATENKLYANVTDTGDQRMNFLYGGIKQSAKTVRLNRKYNDTVDFIKIDGQSYQVDLKRSYRHKTTFEVSGING